MKQSICLLYTSPSPRDRTNAATDGEEAKTPS